MSARDRDLAVGRLSVDNPTLNRFFSLHYLLPFVIAGVVVLHIWALHVSARTTRPASSQEPRTPCRSTRMRR
jgi:quinol-cytochrome oxidoreductase complex cytochrome b subunit